MLKKLELSPPKMLEHQKQHGSKDQWFWEQKEKKEVEDKEEEEDRRGRPGRGGENPKLTIQANYWTTKYLFFLQRLSQVFITRTREKYK